MNILLVLAHPEPRSFNGALKDLAVSTLTQAGHCVVVSDLYAEGFNPCAGPADVSRRLDPDIFQLGHEQMNAARNELFCPELRREISRLMAADLLILQFPMWWYSMPAIMKGWIDRVFAFGVTYDFGRTWDRGVMRGRRAMLSFTTSAPESTFMPDGRNGDLERILWPIHAGVLALCGYDVLNPFVAYGAPFIGAQGRETTVQRFRQRLAHIESDRPLTFHRLDDFDEHYRLKPEIEPLTPGQHRGARRHMA